MKKALWIGIPVILLGIGFYAYQWWKHPSPPKGFVLPQGCDFVAAVNTHRLLEELYRVQKQNIKNLDSGKIKLFIKNSKLDVLKPIYVFGKTDQRFKGICMAFSDADSLSKAMIDIGFAKPDNKIDSFIHDEYSAVIKRESGLAYFYYFKGTAAINKSTIYGNYQSALSSSFRSDEICKGIIDPGAIKRYLSSGTRCDSVCSYSFSLKDNLASVDFTGINAGRSSINEDAAISMQFPWGLINSFKGFREIKKASQKMGIDTTGWSYANGDFKFDLTGVSNKRIKYVTYTLDDEFNRVETIRYSNKAVPEFSISFPVLNNLWYQKSTSDSSFSDHKVKNIFGIEVHFSYKNNHAFFSGENTSKQGVQRNGLLWVDIEKTKNIAQQLNIPAKVFSDYDYISFVRIYSTNENKLKVDVSFKKDWSLALVKVLAKKS